VSNRGIQGIQELLNQDREQVCLDLVYCPECKSKNKQLDLIIEACQTDALC